MRAGKLISWSTQAENRNQAYAIGHQGTTTTPFDMVVLNGMSRFDLAAEALRRAGGHRVADADALAKRFERMIDEAVQYARDHLEDAPDIRDWTWR